MEAKSRMWEEGMEKGGHQILGGGQQTSHSHWTLPTVLLQSDLLLVKSATGEIR